MVKRIAQVSNLGRFRNTRGVITRPSPRRDGYTSVSINKKHYLLDRLIAVAFHDRSLAPPPEEQFRRSNASKRSKPCRGRRLGDSVWTEYVSTRAAARALGVHQGGVANCCRRNYRQTGGFEFEYASPNEPDQLDGEVWRRVEGTLAFVSSLNRFRSARGIISTPSPDKTGYVLVGINGKRYLLHRLIARAFDGEPTANERSENMSSILQSPDEYVRPPSFAIRYNNIPSKPCRGRRVGETVWTEYESINQAARAIGLIHAGHVSSCCSGRMKQIGGFEFEHTSPVEPELLEGEEWRDVVLG